MSGAGHGDADMTTAHAVRFAHLTALRATVNETLKAMAVASQDGTMADWNAARKVSKVACEAASAEEQSIVAEGFDGDLDYEFKVLGRLERRHEASSMTTREVRAALYGA